jgi:hypothetical protein
VPFYVAKTEIGLLPKVVANRLDELTRICFRSKLMIEGIAAKGRYWLINKTALSQVLIPDPCLRLDTADICGVKISVAGMTSAGGSESEFTRKP